MLRTLPILSILGLSLPLVAVSQVPVSDRSNVQPGEQVPARVGGAIPVAPENTAPVPRLPDGTVDLTGTWLGGGPNNDFEREGGLQPGEVIRLLLPAAKVVMDRRTDAQDPQNFCLPMGVPRQATAFPIRFVQNFTHKPASHIFILQEGNMHSYRQVFMDGRKHPEDPTPTWLGHSIGWWEGDTLVVDSVGFNDKFWFDRRGLPHTEQLHVIERWTRVTFTQLDNEVTIADPGAYSRPFKATFKARLTAPGDELREYVCAENNQYGLPSGQSHPYAGEPGR